jgi:outer membrane protein OmpA-like peptidoglycan-associated protein
MKLLVDNVGKYQSYARVTHRQSLGKSSQVEEEQWRDAMIIRQFFIMLSVFISCILPSYIPAAAQTVEEFTEALMPENSQDDKGLQKDGKDTLKTRGLGGMDIQPDKPKVTLHLQFDLNSRELSADAIVTLRKLGLALQNESLRGYVFRIVGHTCDMGTNIYNTALSQRRAMTVRNYLSGNFNLNNQQFEVAWFGEDRPAVPNTDETARQKNRRVVIINTLKPFDLPMDSQKSAVLQIKCLRNGKEQIIQDGDALNEKDPYAVEFKVGTMPYAYIYQVDTEANITRLFPNENFSRHENPLELNRIYRVPLKMHWFYLDENKGKEKIIMLAYHQPISDPQEKCMRVADEKYVSQKTRGFSVIYQEKPATESSSYEEKLLSGDINDLVVILRYFNHR